MLLNYHQDNYNVYLNIAYAINLCSSRADIFEYMSDILYYQLDNLIIVLNTSLYLLQMLPVFQQELLVMLWQTKKIILCLLYP